MRNERTSAPKRLHYCAVGCSFESDRDPHPQDRTDPRSRNGISTAIKGKFAWAHINAKTASTALFSARNLREIPGKKPLNVIEKS